MKRFLLLISITFAIFSLNGQSIADYYENQWIGTFLSYSNFSSNSPAHSSGFKNSQYDFREMDKRITINADFGYYRADAFAFTFDYKMRFSGDYFVEVYRELADAINNYSGPEIRRPYVSSWYELRGGMNVFSEDDKILNAGLAHSFYAVLLDDYITNADQPVVFSHIPFTLGPYIRIDRTLNYFLALRARAAYEFPLIILGDNREISQIFNVGVELISLPGFFIGADYLYFGRLQSQMPAGSRLFHASRLDVNLGIRYR